jgi:SAM-dependent methyltransferase
MNKKIFALLEKNIKDAFKLPKYEKIRDSIDKNTVLSDLPWTPKKYEKFVEEISSNFHSIDLVFKGTLEELTNDIDYKYQCRVWGGEMWKPRTEIYRFTGWNIVKDVNDLKPNAVLDVGCGFNQFKAHIPGLIGIDRYNPNADYMVEIMDFKWKPESFDVIIVFGSINFYSYEWVAERFARVFELLAPGGTVFCRANPFNTGPNDVWIDPYHWDFETAVRIAEENNVKLESWKQDNGDRFYFVFKKP